jgi:hypothetical protein
LNNDVVREDRRLTKFQIPSEIGYMELGGGLVKMFLIPGELYPELQMGGFLSGEDASMKHEADYTILNDLVDDNGYKFVIGLTNDQLGYIIPDNDFLVHKTLPYLNWATDDMGRKHYEETNSTGINTARIILDEFKNLIQTD